MTAILHGTDLVYSTAIAIATLLALTLTLNPSLLASPLLVDAGSWPVAATRANAPLPFGERI
jgi:hypothetical protein